MLGESALIYKQREIIPYSCPNPCWNSLSACLLKWQCFVKIKKWNHHCYWWQHGSPVKYYPWFLSKKHMNKYWICSILIVNAPCSLKAMQRFSASSSSGPGSSSSAPGSSSEDERPSKRTKVEDKLPTIRNLCWNQLQSLEVFRTLLNIWYSFWVWTTLPKNLGWVKHVNYPKLSKVLKMPAKLFTKSVAKMLRGFRWLWRNHVVSGSANEI